MKIKTLTIGILSALMSFTLVFSGYNFLSAKAATEFDGDYLSFQNSAGKFEELKIQYHNSMNDYFNNRTEQLMKDPTHKSSPDDPCTKENVSSYCVGMGALEIYSAYVEKLQSMRNTLPVAEMEPGADAEDLLNARAVQTNLIDQEMEDALKVMKQATSVYDEFRLAYPMHKQYEKAINGLLKYRQLLNRISAQVSEFPLRFPNATTSQCK